MRTIFTAISLVFSLALLQACSNSDKSPEDQIRDFIQTGVEAAESREVDSLNELLHESYLDKNGYNKQQLGGLLRAYVFRHKSIYLFNKIEDIDLLAEK